ncbi:hypothetical protein ACHAQA_009005 [Verticillium albo-atrum]
MADDLPGGGSRDRQPQHPYPYTDRANDRRTSPSREDMSNASQHQYQDHFDGYRSRQDDEQQARDQRDYYEADSGWDNAGYFRDGYKNRGDRGGMGWSRSQAEDGEYEDYGRGQGDGHHRSGRPPSPTRNAGTPSDTVILEGLPPELTSDEVRDCLVKFCDMSPYPAFDVRVPPGKGRRAFVQFAHLDDAVDFVQGNYPKLFFDFGGLVDGDADGRSPVYIHFARNRDEPDTRGGVGGRDWVCATCDFLNYAIRTRCKNCGGPQTDFDAWRTTLTGESDAAATPSQLLVFFPLAPSVTEDVLAVGAAKLELVDRPSAPKQSSDGPPKLKSTAPTGDAAGYGAKPGSLHRVFLMRDRRTNETCKFGFAEFWTVEDALAAVDKFKRMREFTIASAAVSVSTIHLGVFVPDPREPIPATEGMSFFPLFNPAIRVKYWEPSVFPSQRRVTEEAPERPKAKADEDTTEGAKKTKKRKAEGALPGAAKKAAPMMGQMAFWQKKHDEIHEGKKQAELKAQEREQEMARSGERVPVKINLSGVGSGPSGPESRGAIKISLSSAVAVSSVGPPSTSPSATSQHATPDPSTAKSEAADTVVSYVDRDKVCCLLCMMKYKSLDDLNTHERSRNHKTAMTDQGKVKAAQPRIAARDKRMAKTGEGLDEAQDDGTAPQYRDRAKERRQVFSQPNKPGAPPPGSKTAPRKDKDKDSNSNGNSKTASRDATPPAPLSAPPQSKGSAMLAKMGWSSGQGLGAKGEGRTEVIETHAYQEGVGLGAEGGNLGDAAELARRKTTNTYADYLNSAQDKARERYNKLG